MPQPDPLAYYENRLKDLSLLEKQRLLKKSRLAWLRFFAVALAFTAAWLLWPAGVGAGLAGFAAGTGLFIFFLRTDWANNEAIDNTRRLQSVNTTELRVLQHQFAGRPEGNAFRSSTHPYTDDLDIFGHASLYQYLNRTTSEQGAAELASWLKEPASTDIILQRQEAARELATAPEWRQQLQSYGLADGITFSTQEKVQQWLQEKNKFIHHRAWQLLRVILPLVSLGLLAAWAGGFLAGNRFLPLSLLMMIIAFGISKSVLPAHIQLSRISPQLDTLSHSLGLLETASFRATWLQAVVQDSGTASARIRKLSRLLERLDLRLNILVFIPLNTFLFWDLQQVFALEHWKENNKQDTGKWFQALAETEALSSIAGIHFNHPEWVFPVFSDDPAVFESRNLGHPLIAAGKRVTSSFATEGNGRLSLVTGSNMAGKSTFLRSIGVNMVLALAGAPVCAASMTLSPMKVMSSMRISDNLEESTSTFYAELKKLKSILDAVKRNEKVFLLLDEILRGTNSADRHTGSAALIRQLIKAGASGVLATHDLELAALAMQYPDQIRNYHFDVQVNGEELYFDYQLKDGICQSMNASLLMKKIGIEI